VGGDLRVSRESDSDRPEGQTVCYRLHMRTLASVLEDAVARSASEVLLESGQPVVYTTVRGSEAESSVLPGGALFEMIAAVVDDSQQIELAVGNPVEFVLDRTHDGLTGTTEWSVLAEPGMDGIRVRAGRTVGLEIELEHPAGSGSSSGSSSGSGTGYGSAMSGPARGGSADPNAFDMSSGLAHGRPSSPAAAPFESGTWALDDDEEFDAFDDGRDPLAGLSGAPHVERGRRTSAADAPTSRIVGAVDSENYIGVPEDDEDEDQGPFQRAGDSGGAVARRRPNSAESNRVGAGAAVTVIGERSEAELREDWPDEPDFGVAPALDAPVGASAPTLQVAVQSEAASIRATRREIPAASANTPTRREIEIQHSADAETLRELAAYEGEDREDDRGRNVAVDALSEEIQAGTLVYICERGFGVALAKAFSVPSITIDERVEPLDAWSALCAMPRGSIVVVAREDPSAILGWILRRLEEGYRVFIETRASSAEGARRILLGVGASERAERWLRAQSELVAESDDRGARIRIA